MRTVENKTMFRSAPFPVAVVAFCISGLVFAFIQFAGPGLVGTDGYYHIKMASLILHEGLPLNFPYLRFTVLDQARFVDVHMLFHLFQAPFTVLGDLRLAAKIATVTFAALGFAVFIWVLVRHNVRHPLLWLPILFASSAGFLYRMDMPRAQIFGLIFMLLAFHLLIRKHVIGLAGLTMLFVWTYKGFPILLPLTAFALFAHYLNNGRIEFRLAGTVLVGIAAGLIINPYFPQNIFFLWDDIVPKIVGTDYGSEVGNEWYPLDSWVIVKDSAVALAAYGAGMLLTDRREWKGDPARLFWFLTASMWLLLMLKSRRFMEYFPPTAIMFLAFSIRPWLQQLSSGTWKQNRMPLAFISLIIPLVAAGLARSITDVRSDIRREAPVEAYRGAARWLADNTPAGATIFHTDWDDFPRLFFYNTHNTYILGLDPEYMRRLDNDLYWLWSDISDGKLAHPEDAILRTFDAEYVFTDNRHEDFIHIARNSPRMQKVFSDKYATVYRVFWQTQQAGAGLHH